MRISRLIMPLMLRRVEILSAGALYFSYSRAACSKVTRVYELSESLAFILAASIAVACLIAGRERVGSVTDILRRLPVLGSTYRSQ